MAKKAKGNGLKTQLLDGADEEGVRKIVSSAAKQFKDSALSHGESYWRTNLNLAVSTGFWITFFCIPVCSEYVHDLFFVSLDVPGLLDTTIADVQAQWPTVFILLFYMVTKNTGTTVKNCWSSLMGIVVSTLNILVLSMLFPQGGKCLRQGDKFARGLRESCEEFADPNYGKFQWVVWLDFLGFLFVELASNSTESTMKFGVCWHIGYMMKFMNPAGFKFTLAQIATSLLGLFLAIVVTLVPNITVILKGQRPKFVHVATLSLRHLPQELASKVSQVWMNSIHLLMKSPDLDRHTRASMRFAIESKVNAIDPVVKTMKELYDASSWEKAFFEATCKIDRYNGVRKRSKRFIDAFADNIGGFDDVLYCVKKIVLSDEYAEYVSLSQEDKDSVAFERDLVRNAMLNLIKHASNYLQSIAEPSLEEVDEACERCNIALIKDGQVALRKAYEDIPDLPDVVTRARSRLRNQLGCFVFGLLCYTHQVTTFGAKKVESAHVDVISSVKNYVLDTFGQRTEHGYTPFFVQTYNDIDKKMFVGRNFTSISLCFVLGNFLKGNVFDGFNATMATTLAILISHFPGTAFYTNLTRLLGLTLGKVLPIIIMAVVSVVGSKSRAATLVHLAMIWFYESFFAFMSYTSPEWGTMACLVAGFGCGSLVGTRTTTWNPQIFQTQYMEIGQVTSAILVQMMVDVVDTSIRGRWPRDRVVRNMEQLGMSVSPEALKQWNDNVKREQVNYKDKDGAVVDAFEHFMGTKTKKTMEMMLACIQKAKVLMDEQDMLLKECKPKSIVVRGPRTPFKEEACSKALVWIRRVVHEMELLYLVFSKGPDATQGSKVAFHSLHMDEAFQESVLMALRITFMDLQTLLEYDKDGFIERQYAGNPRMMDPAMAWRVETDMPDFDRTRKDFQRDLCVCIAQRALYDALNHISEIQHICYNTGCFDYEFFGNDYGLA